ncbi:MAG: aldolase [Acidobacteria bacterium]|nr:aldolase [Acidobacteriota bacterium]MYH31949.1 aldolase [Acidobacteriota bacterium]
MSTTYAARGTVSRRAGWIAGGVAAALAVVGGFATNDAQAQERTRLNKVIEAIEEGRPAIANQDWRFVDMEHSPFSAQGIVKAFAEADQDRDEQGRMRLTPMVRIPQEGDEDFKWAIKQVLDLGGLGVIVPHVDTGDEAVRLVQAARYPPARDDAQPEPRGERGWGPGRATRLWGVDTAEYHARADVWPLDPDGELFVVAMVESAEAVENIDAILAAPVSAIMVVPGDMSIDLGLGPAPGPENHPEVDAMYDKVLAACQAQDRVICGCGDGAVRLQQRIDEGWQFILPLGG